MAEANRRVLQTAGQAQHAAIITVVRAFESRKDQADALYVVGDSLVQRARRHPVLHRRSVTGRDFRSATTRMLRIRQ